MDFNIDEIQKKLNKYNQSHLLSFLSELTDYEKEQLLRQLVNIDYEKISTLFNSLKDFTIPTDEIIEPLDYYIKDDFTDSEKNQLSEIGNNIFQQNNYAIVTMAGGQGTRLGHNGPKGTFELNLYPEKKSLFEILAIKIQEANEKYNIDIPWYIMTSEENNDETISFFNEKNYFGLNKDNVFFFTQNKLPLVSFDGEMLLAEPYRVHEVSNGNGDIFDSLLKNGLIENMKNRGIKWIFISGIDNILADISDPLFLGLTISNNTQIGSKTIFKKNANSQDWVFCKKNNKPSMLGYERITEEITNAKKDDKYLYREINILCHIFSIDALEKCAHVELPYHMAAKKNIYINDEGMKIFPNKPNSYKFEKFIFDSFKFFDNITLLRVNPDEEFAPIKNPEGVYSPMTATKLYIKQQNS